MTRKIFEGIDEGYAPVLIAVIHDLKDPLAALVYARVWNYCQMDDRICRAAIQTIADDLEMCYKTTLKYLKKLCDAEYLEDLDVGLRNVPHRYKDLEKYRLLPAKFVKNELDESLRGDII